MRRWMSLSLMALVVTTTAFAQDSRLRRLETADAARAWEAVGRLDVAGEGYCTGALISPSLVLTAAHCLFNKKTEARLKNRDIQFLAGWRSGRASSYRGVRRAVVHPDYRYDTTLDAERVRNDLALLELDRPIRDTRIQPFATAAQPQAGDQVGVVSYAQSRSDAPSLQEVCEILSWQEGILITSCSVDFGSSGAPIFAFEQGGAQIVSVVSAKAEANGEPVSLGTSLETPLADLMAELEAGNGFDDDESAAGRRVPVSGMRNTAAKFVKP